MILLKTGGSAVLGGPELLLRRLFVHKLTLKETSLLDFENGLIMLDQLPKRTFEALETSISCGTYKNVGAIRCGRPLIT